MSTNVEAWLKSGRHLPKVMRDWHWQKDLFKAIDELVEPYEPSTMVKRPTWVEAHVYVIDVFLWFMARRGYTLQRTRRPGVYKNLKDDVEAQRKIRIASFGNALGIMAKGGKNDL